ncbi:hypothetical protein C8J57DRAFT_1287737 [Mycena rebaudengoi]|nr:hypothetical protein C8J57DRAFT_1287737 [Mycena rebaudengoi]
MAQKLKNNIIFTGFIAQEPDYVDYDDAELENKPQEDDYDPELCLELFKTMLSTVLQDDSHLLARPEKAILESFQHLSLDAQHLFMYLVNYPKCHRLPHLKDIKIHCGDLTSAIAEVCRSARTLGGVAASQDSKFKPIIKSEPQPIDLLSDSFLDIKPDVKSEPGFHENATAGPSNLGFSPALATSSLCISDADMTLRQLLEYLPQEELLALGKQLKLKGQKRNLLIPAILSTAAKQRTLSDFLNKGKAVASSSEPSSQEGRLREMIMKHLVKLVRVDEQVYTILRRVHTIYFRSTHLPTDIVPCCLRDVRRRYPEYCVQRDSAIWADRASLLVYEKALEAEAAIDAPPPLAQPVNSLPKKRKRSQADDEKKPSPAVLKAMRIKAVLDDIYPMWAMHLALKQKEGNVPVTLGLEHFEAGFVLTRAIHKGAKALGVLKLFNEELDVLGGLLDQRYWGLGFRGAWHARRVLLCDLYGDKLGGGEETENDEKPAGDWRTLDVVTKGLTDAATGIVYRPLLVKRLARLQKRLQISGEDLVDITDRKKIKEVTIEATRTLQSGKKKSQQVSAWKGELSIEMLVSQHYEGLGFRSTLFTLLFWDIIFTPVAGAFETPFQTCPLDMCEDSFLRARRDLITERLTEIESGEAAKYLEEHDRKYRDGGDANRCVVGVRWDLCSRADLRDVFTCISPAILSMICQMFCEDYAGRCESLPSLIAWNPDSRPRRYKLVNIKGPGHPVRQGQKLWSDVLARCSAYLEVCEVVEPGAKKSKKGKGKKQKADASDSDSESEEDELQPESEEEQEGGLFQNRKRVPTSTTPARGSDSDDGDNYQPQRKKRKPNANS